MCSALAMVTDRETVLESCAIRYTEQLFSLETQATKLLTAKEVAASYFLQGKQLDCFHDEHISI